MRKTIWEIIRSEFSYDPEIAHCDKIYSASELMKARKRGGCSSYSILSSSILRSFSYPTAILVCL
ncbi:transglutaminase domain-containing protein [Pyrococcus kukulkanii]|uniref:transglutaminase domain-containing protein n=1 Tax=Pyrococcus kukulkanii TaxID=1609559 RepID=UPI003FF0D86E